MRIPPKFLNNLSHFHQISPKILTIIPRNYNQYFVKILVLSEKHYLELFNRIRINFI